MNRMEGRPHGMEKQEYARTTVREFHLVSVVGDSVGSGRFGDQSL
jgi:hypothetical protein